MPLPRRDLALTHQRFVPWIEKRLPQAEEVRVSEFGGSGTTGFSNDTLLFDLAWREGGRERSDHLVLRIEPAGLRVFPKYDLGLQFRIMQRLGDTGVPVPRTFWLEEDPSVLGNAFYVMGRVDGRIPDDNPTYHMGGWMTEASPEERAAVWWSGVETLARIHRLDWRKLALLPEPPPGRTCLEVLLDQCERYLDWVCEGDRTRYPLAERALAWLRAHRPRGPEPTALCWGDSRLGNMIFRDGRCVAVLDWEMATLGNPEQDLAWWLFFDEHHSAGAGVPRLAGLPTREDTIARYREWSGIDPKNLDYYDLLTCFRFATILSRLGAQFKQYGLMPVEADFDRNNTCTRMLEPRLERVGA
jgi:aminoglycoside phosphotransferase (APT) family kinase protein